MDPRLLLVGGLVTLLKRGRLLTGGNIGAAPPTATGQAQSNSVTVGPNQRVSVALTLKNNGGVQATVTIHGDLVGNGKIQGHFWKVGQVGVTGADTVQVTVPAGQQVNVTLESGPIGNQAQVGSSLEAFFTLNIQDVYGQKQVVYKATGTITPPAAPADVAVTAVQFAVI